MTTLETDSGSFSGGYVSSGRIGPELMADAVARVEQRQYRACDIGPEIIERVIDSFQQLGYFCADVEPITAEQTEKNEFKIAIHVHPGQQYRLKEATFLGATLFSADELRSAFHMKPNSRFDSASVRRGLEALRNAYKKLGYPAMAALPVAAVDETNKMMTLEIKIQEGSPQR